MQLCEAQGTFLASFGNPFSTDQSCFEWIFFKKSDFMQNRTDFSHRAQMQVDGCGLAALIPHFLFVCQKLEGVEGFKIL